MVKIRQPQFNMDGLMSTCSCGATHKRGLEFTRHQKACPVAIAEREESQRISDEDDDKEKDYV